MVEALMDITCLIPTRGERNEGLERAIVSIPQGVKVITLVNMDGWIPAVNAACVGLETPMLLAGDDMIFHKGAVCVAAHELYTNFPDGDGVIGFNQANLPEFCKGGFTLMGDKFLRRFPEGPFCPDYLHYFADMELWQYAESIGRGVYCEAALVDHYHFSVTGNVDSTARVSRGRMDADKETLKLRQDAGILWGREFSRVRGTNETAVSC